MASLVSSSRTRSAIPQLLTPTRHVVREGHPSIPRPALPPSPMASSRVITHPSLISHVIALSCIRPVRRGFGIWSFTHELLQNQRDRIQFSSIELVACQTTSKAVPPSHYAYIGWFGECIGVASTSPACPRPRPVPRRPESLTPAKHLPISSTAPLQAQRNYMDTRQSICQLCPHPSQAVMWYSGHITCP